MRLEEALLVLTVLAAGGALAAPGPGRVLDAHHAIEVVLAVLVFASAVTVPSAAIGRLPPLAVRLLVVLGTAAVVLPLLAFGLSRLLGPAALRDGVLAVGVAPAEVASVALVGIIGGDVAVTAALLIGSTLVSVAMAGPVLAVLAGHGVSSIGVLVDLVATVGVPMIAGLALARVVRLVPSAADGFSALAVIAVVMLVWLVSAQVHLALPYVALAGVLIVLVALSAVVGAVVARGLGRPVRQGVILHVSMRDFAVASAIATSAFGPPAAAPLGLYGVVVLGWGALAPRLAHRR